MGDKEDKGRCHDDGESQPCSKDCACYVARTLAALKQNVSSRSENLKALAKGPLWRVNLTESEFHLLSLLDVEDGDSPSLVGYIVAREVGSRERDLDSIRDKCAVITDEADRYKPTLEQIRACLGEVRAEVESAKSSICQRKKAEREIAQRKKEALDDSERRHRKVKTICNELISRHDALTSRRNSMAGVSRKHELDRAALNSAMRALTRINAAESPPCKDAAAGSQGVAPTPTPETKSPESDASYVVEDPFCDSELDSAV